MSLNPRSTSYEFGGPLGALFVTITVPATVYALYFGCSEQNACRPDFATVPDQIVSSLSDPNWWKGLWDTQAALVYLAWYTFCVVSWAILPGDHVEGTTLRNGEKKTYKCNGTILIFYFLPSHSFVFLAFSTLLLALGLTAGTIYRYGPESFTFLYEKWIGLVTASAVMSFVQAIYCYAVSFRQGKLLALGGNSGNYIYDVCRTI